MAPDGYNLILAGPGSGKTRVITYRVAYLIARGVPADSILLVTFTRRAAREMVQRLETLIGNDAGKVWAGTFHHIGNRLLRRPARLLGYQPNFTILDSEDQLDLIRLAMDDAGFAAKDKLAPKPAEVEHLISFALNTRQSLAEVVAVQSPGLVEWLPTIEIVAAAYARRKLAANCMDYDDLLIQWLRLLREFPDQLEHQAGMFRHILIDEMQDTNALQVEIVETIAASGAGNLTAVGDDAQSIYRFRGANYDNILKFPERHPGSRRFQLDVNYRSTPQIVAFTAASIRHNRSGFPKELVSARADGPAPWSPPRPTFTRRPTWSASRSSKPGTRRFRSARWRSSTATTTTASCSRASWSRAAFPTRCAAACGSSSRPISRMCWPTCGWCRTLATRHRGGACCLLLPGIGPAKAAAIYQLLGQFGRSPGRTGVGRDDGRGPAQEQGVLRGVRERSAADRTRPTRNTIPRRPSRRS